MDKIFLFILYLTTVTFLFYGYILNINNIPCFPDEYIRNLVIYKSYYNKS